MERTDGMQDMIKPWYDTSNIDLMLARAARREIAEGIVQYVERQNDRANHGRRFSMNKRDALMFVLKDFPPQWRRNEKQVREAMWAMSCPIPTFLALFEQEWESLRKLREAGQEEGYIDG